MSAAIAIRARKFYIRIGKLPKGRSEVSEAYRTMVLARTGTLVPKHEKGVSVFPAIWSDMLGRWFIPEEAGTAASLADLWDEAMKGQRPLLLLIGRRVGEGSDAEPLLARKSIKVVAKLRPEQVYADGQFQEGLTDAQESQFRDAKEGRRLYRRLFNIPEPRASILTPEERAVREKANMDVWAYAKT